ncbi:YjgF-like protein [Cadophora sp. DSE1049]|nr:YjgF-like protein [Cadophora sp. DSE1049]
MNGITETYTSYTAPLPVYSQTVQANGLIFCSGSIGIDRDTFKKVDGGIKQQTEPTLKNMAAVLYAAGSAVNKVARLTVYLKSGEDFVEMNEVYVSYFGADKPVCPFFPFPARHAKR